LRRHHHLKRSNDPTVKAVASEDGPQSSASSFHDRVALHQ